MSDPLESVVRPFESGQVSPAQTYNPAGQIGVGPVKLQYGRSGSGKTLSGSYSETRTFYVGRSENEKKKKPPLKASGGGGGGEGRSAAGGRSRSGVIAPLAFGVENRQQRHITRIWGKDKTDTIQEDIWIDVERRDWFVFNLEGRDGGTEEVVVNLKWNDDPNNPQENAREVKTLKVCAHDEEDYEDPEVFVELDAIKSMEMQESNEQHAYSGIGLGRTFKVEPDNQGREVVRLRIHHRSTNIDKDAADAFKAGQKTYVVDSLDYEQNKDDDEEDKDDWVEAEVPKWVTSHISDQSDRTNGTDILITTYLRNEILIEKSGFEDAEMKHTGPDGLNPPYRLDPFQNIVDVAFGGLAVKFFRQET